MNLKNQLKITFVTASLILLGSCSAGKSIQSDHNAQSGIKHMNDPIEMIAQLQNDTDVNGKHNAVLNDMQIGIIQLKLNDIDKAYEHFLSAVVAIEHIYAGNDEAKKARSLWIAEGQKDFKGEPYERSMAYYYLGLTFLLKSDFENARASFETGFMQDSFAEETQYQADFVSLLYLSYWCSLQLNHKDFMSRTAKEIKNLDSNIILPKATDNALVIAELGSSPRKLSDGIGHSEMVFRRGKNIVDQYAYYGNDIINKIEDIYFQASTRGNREIDRIIDGKISFKKKAVKSGDTISNIATTYSLFDSTSVSSIIAIGSGIQSLIGSNVKASVDTRYIFNLPDSLHFYSGNYIENADIIIKDKNKNPLPDLSKQSVSQLLKNGKTIIWNKSN